MKTLREEVSEVVAVMRQQLLAEIGDELRASLSAKHALDTGDASLWKFKNLKKGVVIKYDHADNPPFYKDTYEIQLPAKSAIACRWKKAVAVQPVSTLMVGRGRKIPAVRNIKTEWVKKAISRLFGFHPTGFSYSQILGECRRGRRNVSETHLGPILSRMRKLGLLESPSKGLYRATYKSVATKE